MSVGRGVRDWMRALVGVSGVVAMLGGLFVSLPASADEVGVDGMAPARVSDGSSSPDGTAGEGASASAAPAAGGVADGSGPRTRSGISPQDMGGNTLDCSSGRQTGDGWFADDAGGGRCAVHVTGKAALQGGTNRYGYPVAKFGGLDLDKVVSVSIDNPIPLVPGDQVRLGSMFHLTSLTGVSNLRNATDLSYAFSDDDSLTSLDVSGLDTSHVTIMQSMFWSAGLTSLDVSHFDTSHVTNMEGMFGGALSLQSLDGIGSWDTSHVTNMSWMFYGVYSLTSLDLSGWDTSHVTNMDSMFYSAYRLTSLRLGPRTYFDNATGAYVDSGLSGPRVQVDPAPVPGACYVKDGDQASCSTTDPDQGLLRRPASGGPGQVRTGAVTYAMGNLVRLNYVDAQGAPLAAGVVSGLGLPSWRAGDPGDGFSVALPGNSAWQFTSCSSNPAASPADSCSGASMSGVIGSSDRTLTVTMKHVTSGGGSGDNGSNGSGGSNNGGSNNGGSNNSGGNNNNGSNNSGGNNNGGISNGGNAGNSGNNNGGAAGVVPGAGGVPGRLSVLAVPGAPVSASAPVPVGGSVSPRSGVRRRGRSHTRECVAWLDAGGDGVLSDYGPNGRVVPGQVRQVSDPCADQRSAVIGGAHGVRYVTWLPYFLSSALVGGFAMEAVYLALRRRMDDGDADDGYGRADGGDGRSRAAGSGAGRHAGGRVPLAGDVGLAGVAGMARHGVVVGC